MKAMIYHKFEVNPLIENVPDPTLKPDGVIVKVIATGLCRSDWHGWMGHDPDIILPHIPGHELVGEIIELGKNVKGFKNGDRVTVPFVSGCGHCSTCLSGNYQICDNQFQPGFTAWGSFAEFVALDYADINLALLPDGIDSVAAASLGCRFITSFRGIVDQAETKPGEWVAIYGCGGVGLSAIMIANALGANVIAVDINETSLKLAEKCGALVLINSNNTEVVPTIREISKGGVHVSVDALGSRNTCYNSIACLRKQGKHIQIGLMAGGDADPIVPMHLVIANELRIIGSHGMQSFRYPAIFDLMSTGKINPGIMVTSKVSVEESITHFVGMNNFGNAGITVIDRFQ